MMCKTAFYIGKNLIEIWEEAKTIRTTFPDGVQLTASPQINERYYETAQELGYEDTWLMCKSHEILHTALAVSKGLEYSRGLYRAALKLEADTEDILEEAEVMKIQSRK